MGAELYTKVLQSITDPAAIILFVACAYFAREDYRKDSIISKLLKAQEDRGVVLAKITVMLEAIFADSRRP